MMYAPIQHPVQCATTYGTLPDLTFQILLDHIKDGVAIGIEDADERADGNIALQMREQPLVTPNCCMAA
ncbi:hypothetical protein [Nitrosomonas communis]|uniref:Uncharacterized protein n=1 Tax=Nitrosomonas communis TaxID=44574 RepID=A0A1I4JI63_9PROT|nr:hypothetical protein [Nitrosomonas communis]SFL66252.1 hypothetical protein SAMN05421863_100268 [Nitrosomonas communis]